MKLIYFILISILLTGCFAFDKVPEFCINIDESIIDEVDSVIFDDNAPDYGYDKRYKVFKGNDEYSFFTHEQKVCLNLRLKDSTIIKSDTLRTLSFTNRIQITKFNNRFEFSRIAESRELYYLTLILIIIFVVLIIKIPTVLLIINSNNKSKLVYRFGGLNLFYIIIFVLLYKYLDGIGFLYLYYLIILILDLLYLTNFHKDNGYLRPIIAGVIANLLFLTIGQLIITISIMMKI